MTADNMGNVRRKLKKTLCLKDKLNVIETLGKYTNIRELHRDIHVEF